MQIMSILLQVILGAFFLMTGITKFVNKDAVEEFKEFGYPQGFRIFIGLVQSLGGAALIVGIWIPVLAMLAGFGFALMMLGAIVTHIRVKDPVRVMVKPIVCLVLAIVVAVWNL